MKDRKINSQVVGIQQTDKKEPVLKKKKKKLYIN